MSVQLDPKRVGVKKVEFCAKREGAELECLPKLGWKHLGLVGALLTLMSISGHGSPVPKGETSVNGEMEMLVEDSPGHDTELYSRSDAILIGNINYLDPLWGAPLTRISKQLGALRVALEAHGFHVIVYEDLTSSDMTAALDSFVRHYGYDREARLIFYFAGHGLSREDPEPGGARRVGYAISTDTPKLSENPSNSETAAFLEKAVRFTQFNEWAEAMEARHVLFIFDCCFSGVMLGQADILSNERLAKPPNYILGQTTFYPIRFFLTASTANRTDCSFSEVMLGQGGTLDNERLDKPPNWIFRENTRWPVRFFLTASAANQTVPADDLYTDLLTQALSGTRRSANQSHNGFLSASELCDFLKFQVPELNPLQSPQGAPLRIPLLEKGEMVFQLPNVGPDEVAKQVRQLRATGKLSVKGTVTESEIEDFLEIQKKHGAVVSSLEHEDELRSIVYGLEGDDEKGRKDAQIKLKTLLATAGPAFVWEIIDGVPQGSNRYKLGVASALAATPYWADTLTTADALVSRRVLSNASEKTGNLKLKTGIANALRNAAGDILIGLVTKTEVNPYFVKLRQSANAEAEKQGAKLIARFGRFDGDSEGQVAAIESLISARAKGILITPNNSTGILGAIKKARDKGILVIALDTATDPADAVDATFATDNFEAGFKQGQYARKALGDKPAKLAMLDGTPGGTVDTLRHNGFLKGFGIAEGDPVIVGKVITHGAQDEGQTGMENLLSAHPDINVVYTVNEPVAEGAYAAIKAAGKANDIVVTSIDGGKLGLQYVQAGKIQATVMQFPKLMAAKGVDAVVEYAKTGKKPTGFINTGASLITDKAFPGLESKDTKWGLENCWGLVMPANNPGLRVASLTVPLSLHR